MLKTHRRASLTLASDQSATAESKPIETATSAVAMALAQAHEAGDAAAVRILHAVLALLCAAPKPNAH